MSIRTGFRSDRRTALKSLGGLTAGALLADPFTAALGSSSEAAAFPFSWEQDPADFVVHPYVQAAPQWTFLENGTLALWMLGRSPTAPLTLQPADEASARLLAAFGLSTEANTPGHAGVFLLVPRASGTYEDCLELARSVGRLGENGLPRVSFFVVPSGAEGGAGLNTEAGEQTEPFTLGLPSSHAGAEEFSFVFGSCINPGVAGRVQTLEAMARVKADFCFLLGDTTYFKEAHWTSKEGMLSRWAENRALAAFGALGASKPILGIWDDHDFGPNDSGGAFPYKALSREAFLSHFPRDVAGVRRAGEGIEFTVKIGTTRIVFLDDRTWRDPTPWLTRNGGNYLGPRQFAWFQSVVEQRDYARLIVAAGSQFFAPNPFKESYRRHGQEFANFTTLLQDTLDVPVAFLSGDVHLTEVTALQQMFPRGGVELTSSGIGNTPVGILRAYKRLNRNAYLYDDGLTFARVTVRRDALWFEHFNAEARLLARMRFV